MEPQSRPSPEQSLPRPITPELVSEQPEGIQLERETPSPEKERSAGDAANQNAGPMSLPQINPTTAAIPEPVAVQDDTQTPVISGTPAVAADQDVIEKEWIEKAKSIVKNTQNDPRTQNTQVSHLKADYMQKRYGKTIKLPNDKA